MVIELCLLAQCTVIRNSTIQNFVLTGKVYKDRMNFVLVKMAVYFMSKAWNTLVSLFVQSPKFILKAQMHGSTTLRITCNKLEQTTELWTLQTTKSLVYSRKLAT